MASSVFFRFKSQKEPSRVVFDGTGISVFELKREIIVMNKLGDGTDFELVISSEDTNEIFDDDTSIIPRSTTVIAKRLPPIKPGKGGAARYVSGKMPQNARTSHRSDILVNKAASTAPASGSTAMSGAQTEEQKLAAVFRLGADQWAQQQQEMANATPVHRSGLNKGKPANVPDHPPPPGYICYRCGEKGHWIQVCPTNDDPSYENRPRVKRTTGIPRSFLKTVEKPTAIANDGTTDETKQPAGVMVNAEGEWVIAEPDKAAWDQYQAKAKVSAAAQEAAKQGSKELQDRGLECPIDKHLFVDPTQTPCCQTTFCHDCITNALLENDLRCPECSSENMLIDDLISDTEMKAKVHSFEEEKNIFRQGKESSQSPNSLREEVTKLSPRSNFGKSSLPSDPLTEDVNQRKRPAQSELENHRIPSAPGAKSSEKPSHHNIQPEFSKNVPSLTLDARLNQPLSYSSPNYVSPQSMSTMAFPGMNAFTSSAMTMDSMMGMNAGFPSGMLVPNGVYTGNNWNISQVGGFENGPMSNGAYNQHGNSRGTIGMHGISANYMGMNARSGASQGRSTFANQQRTTFGASQSNDEDGAYFRKPVNPHRHQGRRNVQRPTDYREI